MYVAEEPDLKVLAILMCTIFFGPRPTGAGTAYGTRLRRGALRARVRQSLDNNLRLDAWMATLDRPRPVDMCVASPWYLLTTL